MDYNLAAVKLLCVQLKDAIESPSENAMDLGGILFQRAWLQGILVSVSADGERFLLDDGTGVIELFLSAECRRRPWNIGMYIMAIGRYTVRNAEPPMIHIHKMVDLSASLIERQCGTLKFWRLIDSSISRSSKALHMVDTLKFFWTI